MLHDKLIAAIRTGCAVLGAAVVTWVVSQLSRLGLDVEIDVTWSTALATAAFALSVALYNWVVNYLTENVWPGFGWLLGVNKPPSYVDVDLRPDDQGGVAVDEAAARHVKVKHPLDHDFNH